MDIKRLRRRAAAITALEGGLQELDEPALRERLSAHRRAVRAGAAMDAALEEVFAITREMSRRVLGMRHYDVQLIGAMALHAGTVAEMRTGEGKTLTATPAVVLNALQGRGVHVVTVNDYLARRDAELMRPLYEALGLTVGVLQHGQSGAAKLEAYGADITYATNAELGFDYLRDNMAASLDGKVQHGGRLDADGLPVQHAFAIVDEVDNILIDEARTPLIISGADETPPDLYRRFAKLARILQRGERPEELKGALARSAFRQWQADFDFEADEKHKTISITERGAERAEKFLGIENLYAAENGHLVNHLTQAIRAQALHRRDVDYAVIDATVQIIDEFTGRILDGRRWSEGLHQAVEAKEGVEVLPENHTLASTTYQNFFRLYDKLAGMTGTGATERAELSKIYNLAVTVIPTHRPVQRVDESDLVFATAAGKWNAVVQAVAEEHRRGRPILVGTTSVQASEHVSALLTVRGIEHSVLNARPEHAEREGITVAQAGRPGAVTIATNMAGRGVDIKLGGDVDGLLAQAGAEQESSQAERIAEQVRADHAQVIAAGGLLVIGTERHESRRIDNQLRGRAGRQGDPGTSRFYLSLEDDLLRLFGSERLRRFMRGALTADDGTEAPLQLAFVSRQIEKAQRKVEEHHFLNRKRVLEYDDVMAEQRRVVYAYRDQVLAGQAGELLDEQVEAIAGRLVDTYLGVALDGADGCQELLSGIQARWPSTLTLDDLRRADTRDLKTLIAEDLRAVRRRRRDELGARTVAGLERMLMLNTLDARFREHLRDMDYLRNGIGLRGLAQRDPLAAYKFEAFKMFDDMMDGVWDTFTSLLLSVEVDVQADAPLPARSA